MRTAFLITSYVLPDQVLRLARTLRAGSSDAVIVLHHDDRRSRVDEAALAALGVGRIVPPSPAAWGEGSQLDLVLRGLRYVLEHTDAGWVVLLSGQDYPIRPVAEIERSLAAANCDAFVEALPVPALGEYALRYHHRWRPVPEPAWPVARAAARITGRVQRRRMPSGPWVGVRVRFPAGFVCHRGGDWFTLSRRALESVERSRRDQPELLEHFRRTLIPTEGYVQTVLANDPSLELSGDTRRFTRWEPRAPRPAVLTLDDLPAMRASGMDVARKFDPEIDRAVLDAIDREVHGS